VDYFLLRYYNTNGQHVYNICLENRPDLVILDIMLPVADGATCFGDDNTKILNIVSKNPKSSRSSEILTAREREILQLVAEGLSTRLISEKLSISIKTAENHRTNLMRKLDLHNAAGLTRYAVDMGFVENTPLFD